MHLSPGNVELMTPSKAADPDLQRRNGWFNIHDWAAEWGLKVGILPKIVVQCRAYRELTPGSSPGQSISEPREATKSDMIAWIANR